MTSKTYEVKYRAKKFAYHVFMYCYLTFITTSLTIWSPNDVALDNSDGGRALIYILCFGTALMVLQLQIGHLCHRDYNPHSSKPFMIGMALLTMNLFFVMFPTLDPIGMKAVEKPLHWAIAVIFTTSKSLTMKTRCGCLSGLCSSCATS